MANDDVIRAGDLVVVLRNHCTEIFVGAIFEVTRIEPHPKAYCGSCNRLVGPVILAHGDLFKNPLYGMPIHWLKKIQGLPQEEIDEIMYGEKIYGGPSGGEMCLR